MRVLDVAQGEPAREIGGGSVFRVAELEGAELLEIDLGAARGETLRVEIVDGDSPPLAELTLEAVVRQPVLVFAPPARAVWYTQLTQPTPWGVVIWVVGV